MLNESLDQISQHSRESPSDRTRIKYLMIGSKSQRNYKRSITILCVDLMFVNGIPFLMAIDRTIRYRSVVPLENRTKDQLYKALDVVLHMYNEAGYRIREIHANNEFRQLFKMVADDLDLVMNYTNAGDHVPEAERNNRIL